MLRVSPFCTPIRLIASVAGPPKGSSVPSWQYTSRKEISSRVRIMVWLPVDLPAELRLAANNRYTVAPPGDSRGNQPSWHKSPPELAPIERLGSPSADKPAAEHSRAVPRYPVTQTKVPPADRADNPSPPGRCK